MEKGFFEFCIVIEGSRGGVSKGIWREEESVDLEWSFGD